MGASGERWVFPKTAQVFQHHPRHTQGGRAGLKTGTREARRQGLVPVIETLANVLISLLFAWVFRFLICSSQLYLLEERSTGVSLHSMGKEWGCLARGGRDTFRGGAEVQLRCYLSLLPVPPPPWCGLVVPFPAGVLEANTAQG